MSLDETVAALAAYAYGTRALRVAALVDRGDDEVAAVVEIDGEGLVVADALTGEPLSVIDVEPPDELPAFSPAPSLHADAATGEIRAAFGALESLAEGVVAMAALAGGRSAVTATFASEHEDAPVTIAARVGDPIVLAIGERQFEAPPGWP